MLWRSSTLIGTGIRARDGAIGSLSDLLFDDQDWTIRWAVVDTGGWLSGRKVLLPPHALGAPRSAPDEFPVDLTRQQVEDSPGLESDAPVSRQQETEIYSHYGWEPYWYPGLGAWPGYAVPLGAPLGLPPVTDHPPGAAAAEPLSTDPAANADPHLRSAREVTGYYIQATDDDIGHVEEFLVGDEDWVIRYVVVDTRNWWPGKKVLVAPRWFHDVNWRQNAVSVGLSREQVRNSPEYDPSEPVGRPYEAALHRHYGLDPYWQRERAASADSTRLDRARRR